MDDEMISIAMATYNGEKYLREQLDSILAQTHQNFELIVCDDCSTDSTVQILRECEKNDSRIKVFVNEENLGYVQNFLKALSLCSSKWIFLSDQGDIWEKKKIECFLEVIKQKENQIKMIVSDFDNFPVDNSISFFKSSRKILPISFKKCIKVCSFAGMAMCINRSILPDIMGNGVENHISHDWEISLIASHGKNNGCYFLNTITAHHRIHEQNASSIKGDSSSKQAIYETRRKYLERNIQLFEYAISIKCLSKYENLLLKKVLFFLYIRKKVLNEKSRIKLFIRIPKAFFFAILCVKLVENSVLILCRDFWVSIFWNVSKLGEI